jgi:hypothetical protein
VFCQAALRHPWFSRFAEKLLDHRHFRVIDNRLFDLVIEDNCDVSCLAFENEQSGGDDARVLARSRRRDAAGLRRQSPSRIVDRERLSCSMKPA